MAAVCAWAAPGGVPSDKAETDPFPVVQWVSLRDGTRDENEIEDRAARYLPEQNILRVNADLRVFTDMVRRLCKERKDAPDGTIEGVVTDVVHAWFEQALIETVIGLQQLKGSKEWGAEQMDVAFSEEALTATVMQRYHVHNQCRMGPSLF
jgi:coenzyme F420-reducing hydrogenase beta subunit